MGFLTGSPAKMRRVSTLDPEQLPLKQQLLQASQAPGAGGAFGSAADYYRDLLSDDSNTFNAMAAPETRRFREDIIPGLSEQFAGMGSGGLSSSGFRNAAVNAGTDLSERLGAIRAQLRSQGAAGLTGIGQQGLQSYGENIRETPQEGFLQGAAPLVGTALGSFAGPAGSAVGNVFGNWATSKFGKTSPYGAQGAKAGF